ncbi:hypothetical protein [Patulibacter sp. SYSU D01012]|uniref:hypothetical protein n=1 Tax=Patulibacter sp. SYSU D01012 TaxID=2817381 RepID=UPI001B317974|nr:hypothetical protein [Patulibacter sp. SYSU D01012]
MSAVEHEPVAAGDPYDAIAELAVQQLVAAQTGDLDRMEQLMARWAVLVATLPDTAPPGARAALERAATAHAQTSVLLTQARDGVGDGLARSGTARRVAVGYRATAAVAAVSRQA